MPPVPCHRCLTINVVSRYSSLRWYRQKQRRKSGRRDPTQGQNQDPRAGKERSAPMSVAPYAHCLRIERGQSKRPDPPGVRQRPGVVTTQRVRRVMTRKNSRPTEQGRGLLPQRIPPLPQRAMGETTLNKKMRAFDDEVALTVAQLYLVRMLQRTLPAGSSRRAFRPKPTNCHLAANGCMRLSTTASASLRARQARR